VVAVGSGVLLLGVFVFLLRGERAGLPGPGDDAGASLPDLRVVPPPTGVPADVAAFSGRWLGSWDRVRWHALLVSQIAPGPRAGVWRGRVFYWSGGILREVPAEIRPGVLDVEGPPRLRFTLAPDGQHLEAQGPRPLADTGSDIGVEQARTTFRRLVR
jgi:hypothetical protein